MEKDSIKFELSNKNITINENNKPSKYPINATKKLVIVKNGDHSLSSPKWIKILKKELKIIVS